MTAKSGARPSTGHVWQSGLGEQGAMQAAWSGNTSHADWSLEKSWRAITSPEKGSVAPGHGLWQGAAGWGGLALPDRGLWAAGTRCLRPLLAHRPLIRLSSLSLPR